MAKNKIYKRKTKEERAVMFAALAKKLGHTVINIEPPKDKEQIKLARQSSRLSGSQAAVVCGVSRRSWTAWLNNLSSSIKPQTSCDPNPIFSRATNQCLVIAARRLEPLAKGSQRFRCKPNSTEPSLTVTLINYLINRDYEWSLLHDS